MTTLFISDLHLDDRRPETTALFLQFLDQEVSEADTLFILGDMFEYWLGDDVESKCSLEVAEALSRLTANGLCCFFMHGNRDFLLRETYATKIGVTLLPQEYLVNLDGEQVLLLHGDSLCTDDVAYQQFRSLVRNPVWQDDFLAKTAQQRLQIAMQARDVSAEHKNMQSMEIMDVNQAEVVAAFERHDVTRMIHGHTHRPAIHKLTVNGKQVQRFVLGDWYTQSSVLRVQSGHYDLLPPP